MDAAENIETTAIVKPLPAAPVRVNTPRALVLAQALEEEREQRQLLKRYVEEFMVEGEDYGTIPGVKKKSLWKPGAEKLFDLFRCRPEYEFIVREVNHESGLYYYEIRCRSVNRESGTVMNEGVGSASSYESKYRYRNADRVCPACGKAAIIKGKAEYGGGWVCFKKKDGCGAKYADDAPEITGQAAGKVQNPDLADVANVVLKMAKKRAHVDCAIALARVSDMFTQDVEDLVEHVEAHQDEPRREPERKPAPAKKTEKPAPGVDAQVMALWNRLVKDHGGDKTAAKRTWAAAATAVGAPETSSQWTKKHLEDVERELYRPAEKTEAPPPDDIPF